MIRDSWLVTRVSRSAIREMKQRTTKSYLHGSRITNHESPLAIVAVQLEELDGRGILELDVEAGSDLAQGVIEVREVVDGHVANEGAANFVVAGAAVQPAEEEEQLEARGEADDDPVGIHGGLLHRLFTLSEMKGSLWVFPSEL